MDPEWTDFKILSALARGGSVAGAARELGVDSSTVSRRLAALEESLGARLIVRGGREFAWTALGRSALAAAETMTNAVEAVTRACRDAKLEASGAVRVSMPPAFVPLMISQLLPKLREETPALKLDVRGDLRKVDLAKGEADIAVRMVRPSEPDLVGRRAFESGWCVFSSDAYAAARGTPASLTELSQHHLVLYDESLHAVEPLRWMEQHRGTNFVRVDNLELASQLITAGSGIGLLPAACQVISPSLVRVFPQPVTSNEGWLVYHEAVRETARVRAAVEVLARFFDGQPALFTGRT